METKHTPGPWEIDTATRPDEICIIHGVPPQGDESQEWVYVRGALGYWDAEPEERMANARLIAAAPDLLAAAQQALAECADLIATPAGDALHAAIAKATGSAA